MPVDPSTFHRLNVTDACAVWNVLSSKRLHATAISVGCSFSLTGFVRYECLVKPRSNISEEDKELQQRLEDARSKGQFRDFLLDIQDLQEIEVLERRKKLGKGELSSIAFAKRTRQAFLTDDQKARKLAEQTIEEKMVQTTPHLFGWLIFEGVLSDGDKDFIIKEHEDMGGELSDYLQILYERALYFKLQGNKDIHSSRSD